MGWTNVGSPKETPKVWFWAWHSEQQQTQDWTQLLDWMANKVEEWLVDLGVWHVEETTREWERVVHERDKNQVD
ncbi:hypothetical protein Y1Q_0000875 [Alligator mississippiensis]|uniref:Uncharacterized protein n=1 Tax=Alligator mississippiensis TaxID=8496 RepID=A0A151NJN5_ALLMI|nr:hypothetical protein Y1Q_0000875 [Alligator mississippiensis]